VTTTYDVAGKPSGVTGYASAVNYAPHGAMQGLTFANNVQESWMYNVRLQPTCLTVGPAAQPVLRLGNAYTSTALLDPCSSPATAGTDNNGNVVKQTIRAGWMDAVPSYQWRDFSLSYGYTDGMNRLNSAAETTAQLGWNQTMGYDTWGNLSLASSWGSSIWSPPGYGGATNHATGTGWSYTPSGNLWTTPLATMTYDPEGHLETFQSVSLGVNSAYGYDGEGRRVKKTLGSTTVVYVYDAMGELAAEYGSAAASTGTQFLTADHLGSTRLVTGTGGVVVERHDYAPFGDEVAAQGCAQPIGSTLRSPRCDIAGYGAASGDELKFTGKERDAETGLDFFGARYMSSAQGRFTSPDPLPWLSWQTGGDEARQKFLALISNPQNLNMYSYVGNNPLNHTDPTGMNACGTNDDSTCKVEITITSRDRDANLKYNDQFKDLPHQKDYNAIATVVVNGETEGTFLVKTTPDDSNKSATLLNGTYDATFAMHKQKYAAIALEPRNANPTLGPNPSRDDGASIASDIHIHKAGLGNAAVARNGSPISQGCQVIYSDQYPSFQSATGIVPAAGSPQKGNIFVRLNTITANAPWLFN
jgi:RHS repeat-associated protein